MANLPIRLRLRKLIDNKILGCFGIPFLLQKGNLKMRRTVDITSKLTLEENPILKIGDVELEVQANAKKVLEVMSFMNDDGGINTTDLGKVCELIFTENADKKIDELGLLLQDYQIVVMEAINLIVGKEQDSKEQETETPATT